MRILSIAKSWVSVNSLITLAWVVFILVLCYMASKDIKSNSEKKDALIKNNRKMEMWPSIISTMGVLGTFFGITWGLFNFDSNNLNNSIPHLLDGLRTAFTTSLLGMIGSVFISKKVNKAYDTVLGGTNDINSAAILMASKIGDLLTEFKNQTKQQAYYQKQAQQLFTKINDGIDKVNTTVSSPNKSNDEMLKTLKKVEGAASAIKTATENMSGRSDKIDAASEKMKAAVDSIAQMTGDVSKTIQQINEKTNNATSSLKAIQKATTSIATSIGKIEETTNKQSKTASKMDAKMDMMMKHTEAIAPTQCETEKISKGMERLNAEITMLNTKNDEMLNKAKEINRAAATIMTSTKMMSERSDKIDAATAAMAVAIASIAQMTGNMSKTVELINEGTNNAIASLGCIQESAASITTSAGNIEETARQQSVTTTEMNGRMAEIIDHTEAMVSTEGEISERVQALTDKLHGEVVEIEEKMTETNSLLERKFDEFSELLKKNNTEALVEGMKRVTEEFQTQMNALISKLVQENFDQLNHSVEKLNKWQEENKEMIASLTKQYRQMADNFENTSHSLANVKKDTKDLVSEGGRLDQLVRALNEVIIQDKKFKAISADLCKTADLSKTNMESFDQSTRKLNEWVKNQRNFTDSVAVLIKKLDELNEMRNYASTFWKETKTGMNDAVGLIKNGSKQLNQQLTNLDQQFYARLGTTLAQLDACISSHVNS